MMKKRTIKSYLITDKTKSTIDEKRSDPKRGLFLFKKDPKPVRYKLKDNTGLAPYWFHWIWNNPANIDEMRNQKGYSFVKKADRFIPEGMTANGEGHYQYKDVVLMRRNLREWVMERVAARELSKARVGAVVNAFKSHLIQSGMQAGLPKGEMESAIEYFTEEVEKVRLKA